MIFTLKLLLHTFHLKSCYQKNQVNATVKIVIPCFIQNVKYKLKKLKINKIKTKNSFFNFVFYE